MPTPSANTQAVLLLTSPLLRESGGGSGEDPVLSAAEYAELATRLQQERHQPADLIHGSREALLSSLSASFAAERLQRLLSRGFQLSQAVEHWASRSISVIGRADPTYPKRLKQRLRQSAPPLLYACGNLELLRWPAIAVVGSHSTPEALLQQAEAVGALAAAAGVAIACGAAKGVGEAAMLGSLAAGGCAIGVVADRLEKVSAKALWRQALLDGRLLLLSRETPSARGQEGRATDRDKLLYALAHAALVVSAALEEGDTWAGASEQLRNLRFCPIHVLHDPRGGPGLAALAAIGAAPWPEPASPAALRALLHGAGALVTPARDAAAGIQQGNALEPTPPESTPSTPTFRTAPVAQETQAPAAKLAAFVDELVLSCLHKPMALDQLAELLDVSKAEVRRWCERLVAHGRIRKLSKPPRYVRNGAPPPQEAAPVAPEA